MLSAPSLSLVCLLLLEKLTSFCLRVQQRVSPPTFRAYVNAWADLLLHTNMPADYFLSARKILLDVWTGTSFCSRNFPLSRHSAGYVWPSLKWAFESSANGMINRRAGGGGDNGRKDLVRCGYKCNSSCYLLEFMARLTADVRWYIE